MLSSVEAYINDKCLSSQKKGALQPSMTPIKIKAPCGIGVIKLFSA
jgi:hypothetical protein